MGKMLTSSVNLRSGLLAVGALRPEEGDSQEPVALETTVVATGARPGDTASKRELFTEETQTVLVFERGAVIRLSAAVADGQLLFLTNKATGKEVVTQVLRKRSFRPTNCYVDLQFTEPCPGFWGIEFPKVGAASGGGSAAKKLSADEDSEVPTKPAIPPSVQEVEHLKHEVADLQTQLKSLQQPGQNPDNPAAQTGAKAGSEISAELTKKEEEKRLEELFAMEAKQEASHLPKRLVAYPQKSSSDKEKESSSRKWMLALGTAIVLTAAAGAAYRFGGFASVTRTAVTAKPTPIQSALLPSPQVAQKSADVPSATGSANGATSQPSAEQQLKAAKKSTVNSDTETAIDNNVDSGDVGVSISAAHPIPSKSPAAEHSRSTPASSESKRSKRSLNSELPSKAAESVSNAGTGTPSGISDVTSEVTFEQGDYVAPKLIKGSKSVAPPEAIQNYIAGNVSMDALVDSTGHIRTVKILAGPAKLYAKATEVMKQYLYEPAKKNGKPVPAHVQVSLQFWYAP
jgi:hypothetical protein